MIIDRTCSSHLSTFLGVLRYPETAIIINPDWYARRKWPLMRHKSNAQDVFQDQNFRAWKLFRAHNSINRGHFDRGVFWSEVCCAWHFNLGRCDQMPFWFETSAGVLETRFNELYFCVKFWYENVPKWIPCFRRFPAQTTICRVFIQTYEKTMLESNRPSKDFRSTVNLLDFGTTLIVISYCIVIVEIVTMYPLLDFSSRGLN